jgi:hypothetical protein
MTPASALRTARRDRSITGFGTHGACECAIDSWKSPPDASVKGSLNFPRRVVKTGKGTFELIGGDTPEKRFLTTRSMVSKVSIWYYIEAKDKY